VLSDYSFNFSPLFLSSLPWQSEALACSDTFSFSVAPACIVLQIAEYLSDIVVEPNVPGMHILSHSVSFPPAVCIFVESSRKFMIVHGLP